MSATPAAVLARLKVTYPHWLICAIPPSEPGPAARYFAYLRADAPLPSNGSGKLELWADTPAALELALINEAENAANRHGARLGRRR